MSTATILLKSALMTLIDCNRVDGVGYQTTNDDRTSNKNVVLGAKKLYASQVYRHN